MITIDHEAVEETAATAAARRASRLAAFTPEEVAVARRLFEAFDAAGDPEPPHDFDVTLAEEHGEKWLALGRAAVAMGARTTAAPADGDRLTDGELEKAGAMELEAKRLQAELDELRATLSQPEALRTEMFIEAARECYRLGVAIQVAIDLAAEAIDQHGPDSYYTKKHDWMGRLAALREQHALGEEVLVLRGDVAEAVAALHVRKSWYEARRYPVPYALARALHHLEGVINGIPTTYGG